MLSRSHLSSNGQHVTHLLSASSRVSAGTPPIRRTGLRYGSATRKLEPKTNDRKTTGKVVIRKKERRVKPSKPTWQGRNFQFTPLSEKSLTHPLFLRPKDALDKHEEGLQALEPPSLVQPPKSNASTGTGGSGGRQQRQQQQRRQSEEEEEIKAQELARKAKLKFIVNSPEDLVRIRDWEEAENRLSSTKSLCTEALAPSSLYKPVKLLGSRTAKTGIPGTFGVPRRLVVEHRVLPAPLSVVRPVTFDLVRAVQAVDFDSTSEELVPSGEEAVRKHKEAGGLSEGWAEMLNRTLPSPPPDQSQSTLLLPTAEELDEEANVDVEQIPASSSKHHTHVLTGPSGCGKSVALLQAIEFARRVPLPSSSTSTSADLPTKKSTKLPDNASTEEDASGGGKWIVIYIPRCHTLINSSSPHVYDLRTRTYVQTRASAMFLQKILSANKPILRTLQTSQDRPLGSGPIPLTQGHLNAVEQAQAAARKQGSGDSHGVLAGSGNSFDVAKGTTLEELCELGIREHNIAPYALEALFDEIAAQESHPTLLALDSFQSLFANSGKSHYKDPLFASIKVWNLSLPRLLLEYVSGRRSFRKGAILAALTSSDTEWPVSMELKDRLGLEVDVPSKESAYTPRHNVLQTYAGHLKNFPIPPTLSLEEAAGIFDIWLGAGAVHSHNHDESYLANYTTSSGNARKFVWDGILKSLDI